jgi:hypothetical protein
MVKMRGCQNHERENRCKSKFGERTFFPVVRKLEEMMKEARICYEQRKAINLEPRLSYGGQA